MVNGIWKDMASSPFVFLTFYDISDCIISFSNNFSLHGQKQDVKLFFYILFLKIYLFFQSILKIPDFTGNFTLLYYCISVIINHILKLVSKFGGNDYEKMV